MKRLWAVVLLCPALAWAQAAVSVDPAADVHPISPLIYGMNYAQDAHLADGVTMTRWGGNSTSRYNYEIGVTNTGFDYYFENIPDCWNAAQSYCQNPPADPKEASDANAFIQHALSKQVTMFFTVPTMGWVAKAPPVYSHPFPCGCPKTVTATQDSFDPYDTNCGNGQSNGQWIACAAPSATSVAITADWNRQWAAYLVSKFGPSNGKRIYQVDNEPNLWNSTHYDVHPANVTYDELWEKMRDNAVALLDSDPTAPIAGPAEWGWPNYFCSGADNINNGCFPTSPDRAAHGGVELSAWLLQQAKAYEDANGKRLLHYFDLHYYPQGGNTPAITRSLWDPTYTDPSWINDKIRLIPRMRDWVNQNYPGTKISLSEYDWHHHNEALGAVLYADALGIFGRERLDAATAWSPPAVTDIAFAAFRLYRNYDGAGGAFGSTGVRATVSGSSSLNAYAATDPGKVTVALVNGGASAVTTTVSVASLPLGAMAQWYTRGTGSAVVKGGDVVVTNGGVQVTVPAMGLVMVVIPADVPGADGGTDAGTMEQDAGVAADGGGTTADAGGTTDAGDNVGGAAVGSCGCSGSASSAFLTVLGAGVFAAFASRRRRRS